MKTRLVLGVFPVVVVVVVVTLTLIEESVNEESFHMGAIATFRWWTLCTSHVYMYYDLISTQVRATFILVIRMNLEIHNHFNM
jgi:hypothetical protein